MQQATESKQSPNRQKLAQFGHPELFPPKESVGCFLQPCWGWLVTWSLTLSALMFYF
jgi:hypothetical protein